jgi:hypothetical protein
MKKYLLIAVLAPHPAFGQEDDLAAVQAPLAKASLEAAA